MLFFGSRYFYNNSPSSSAGPALPEDVVFTGAGAGAELSVLGVAGAELSVLGVAGALLNLKLGAAPTGDGLGLTVGALLAASNALALRSLSPPANIIPLSVPVKNVAIGIINSKNF